MVLVARKDPRRSNRVAGELAPALPRGAPGRDDRKAVARTEASDLEDELAKLARAKQLAAFPVEERFHEIGDEAALAETTKFVQASPLFAALGRKINPQSLRSEP
jgi:hypothetical protein